MLNNCPKKPLTVPENIATPSFLFSSSSKSKWGSESSSFFKKDNEDNFIIVLYPSSFNANKGIRPVVSPNLKLIWVPIIGWDPDLDNFSANSKAPHRLEVSHKPIAFSLLSLEISFKSSNLIAPSQIENWECIFRWLKFSELDSCINGPYITINYFQHAISLFSKKSIMSCKDY